jgi:hypothetical protein
VREIKLTRTRRLFLVLATTAIVGSNIYAAQTQPVAHPTLWYFWTSEKSQSLGIGLRSAGDYREYDKRCGAWHTWHGVARKSNIPWIEYHGVFLCNAGDHLEDEFERRLPSFRAAVDKEYARYRQDLTNRHFDATATSVGLCLGALAIYGIGLWIMRGKT